MEHAKEIIAFAGLEVHFYFDQLDTDGQSTMFKVVAHPGARMGVPHYHEAFDEAIYGLKGNTTYMVDGKTVEVGPGTPLFIKRGVTHGFANNTTEPTEFLCMITSPTFGPPYFREAGAVLSQPGPPDTPRLKEILLRHGLVPVMQS